MGGRGASYAKASGGGGGGVKIISNDEIDMKGSEKQVKWAKDIRKEYIYTFYNYEYYKTSIPNNIVKMLNKAGREDASLAKQVRSDKKLIKVANDIKNNVPKEKYQRERFEALSPYIKKAMNNNDSRFWIDLWKDEPRGYRVGGYKKKRK